MKEFNYIIIDRVTDEYLSGWSFDNPKAEKWNSLVYEDGENKDVGDDCYLFKSRKEAQQAKKMLDEAFSSRGDEIDFIIARVVRFVPAVRYRIVKGA